MSTEHTTATDPALVEVLRKALERAEEPVTASQLQKDLSGPFKRSADQIGPILDDLVARGQAHRFAPYRSKAPRYWAHDLDHYARSAMLRLLAKRPITAPNLIKGLKSALKGVSPERLRQILGALQQDGQVHKLPTYVRSRIQLYSAHPPDPRDYLNDVLEEIYKKLEKAGVSRAQVNAAALELLQAAEGPEPTPRPAPPPTPEPDLSEEEIDRMILDGVRQLAPNAAERALVPLRELRSVLQDRIPDKATFDEAVLRLAVRARVDLHRHDFPSSLSEDERQAMVPDGRGSYFIGIALR